VDGRGEKRREGEGKERDGRFPQLF